MNPRRPTLSPSTWQYLTELGQPRQYPRGSMLMAEGDPAGCVLALVSGTVDVVLANGRNLASITPGELVGEMSAVDGLPRSASVIAATDVEVRALGAPMLLDTLRQREPEALPAFVAAVARLRSATEIAAIEAGGAPVRHVASWLTARLTNHVDEEASSETDEASDKHVGLFVDLDPVEVAAELQISSELLSRALGHLATAGSVVLDHGRVLVLDADILRRLSWPG